MLLDRKLAPLQRTARIEVVAKFTGQLLGVLGWLILIPTLVSLYFHDFEITLRYLIVELILFACGFVFSRLDTPTDIQINEGLVITSLIFILTPLMVTIPFTGEGLGFVDALFEAISAVTTTGLTTVSALESMSATFIFSRAYLQWIGGLGIVVLTVALLLRPGMAAKRLIHLDESEDLVSSTQAYAQTILKIYLILTACITALIWATEGNFFVAITHAFAAVSTGGFSGYNDSLAGFNNTVGMVAVMVGCVFGALPLLLYQHVRRLDWRSFMADPQLRALLILVSIASFVLGMLFTLQLNMPWSEALLHAPLLAISAQSTAGFASLPLAELGGGVLLILILLMFTGGSLGSTAGGIKLLRMLIFLSLMKLSMQRIAVVQHAVIESKLGKEPLGEDEIIRALLLILLFIAVIFLSWLAFVIAGYDPLGALFEVVSAVGTVGLSSGITDSDLPAFLKAVLCVDMLLGRLEIIALLVLLYPATWIKLRSV